MRRLFRAAAANGSATERCALAARLVRQRLACLPTPPAKMDDNVTVPAVPSVTTGEHNRDVTQRACDAIVAQVAQRRSEAQTRRSLLMAAGLGHYRATEGQQKRTDPVGPTSNTALELQRACCGG